MDEAHGDDGRHLDDGHLDDGHLDDGHLDDAGVDHGDDEYRDASEYLDDEYDDDEYEDSFEDEAEAVPLDMKRRIEAAPVELTTVNWRVWGPVIVAVFVAIGAIAAWAVLSGNNNSGELQVVSTQELLTPDCSWTIAYDLKNVTDTPLQAVDTRVVTNSLSLFVTQTAPDVVVPPNSTFTNTIVYGLPDCPPTAEEIDHGPLEVFYADSTGKGQTLSADF